MRLENGAPADPADRRPLAALFATLAVAWVFVGLAAIMGTGRAIDWIVTDLLPMVVLLGVVVGVFGLLAREGGKVYDNRCERPSTTFREGRRAEGRETPPTQARMNGAGHGVRVVLKTGDGFFQPVYWLLVCLFLLAGVTMVSFTSGLSSTTSG